MGAVESLISQTSSRPNHNTQISYGDYLRFHDLILERSGLYFPEKKRIELETGLLKALAESPLAGTANLNSYYNLLRDKDDPVGQSEMKRLINTLTIGETHFFRDEPQFNALATQVLPLLIERKRAAARTIGSNIPLQLRIWSAGCASGEEPYSLAMLLQELLPDINNWHIFILATDINHHLLARARDAIYSNWSFREARAKVLRSRYFTFEPVNMGLGKGRYRLHNNIKQMVTFAPLNLIGDTYPSVNNNTTSMDLIMCRNVTIYFTEEITQQVVKQFYQSLVDGGWLVVGHSEPSLTVYRDFQVRTFSNTLLYQKTGHPTAWPDDWERLTVPHFDSYPKLYNTIHHPDQSFTFPNTSTSSTSTLASKTSNASQPLLLKKTSAQPPYSTATPTPASADPYDLAETLLHQGFVKEAIAQLQNKLAAAPNFAPAHALLGQAYANMGQWEEARHWCESAIKLDNLHARTYYILALVYQHDDQQSQTAISLLKKAIYLERNQPLPHLNLAMLYKKTGQAKNARRAFRNVIKILEKWPPEAVVPDSGGATVKNIYQVAQQMLKKLDTKESPQGRRYGAENQSRVGPVSNTASSSPR